jgi:hypothetical protein
MLSNMEAEALSEVVIIALCRLQFRSQVKLAGPPRQNNQAISKR